MAVNINVSISERTKDLLERESHARGIRTEVLIEEALLHHLQALHELPADVVIRPRLVISAETAEALLEQLSPERPTPQDSD